MRTLIFGGSGLLGSNYIFYSKNKKIFNYFNKNKANNVKNYRFNLSNLNRFIIDNKIELLINFAGVSDVEKCEKKKLQAFNVNVKLPERLAEVCKILKVKFVHISTDHFNCNEALIKETSKIKTLNYYAFTKHLSEKKVLKKNKNSLVLRTNFFGSLTNKKSFLEKIIFSIKKKEKIFLWRDTFFNPVSIKYLVGIMNKLINKKARGIYNIASDKCISKYVFGLMVAKKYKLSNTKIIESFKSERLDLVNRPNKMCLDNKKVKKFLNIKNVNIYNQI